MGKCYLHSEETATQEEAESLCRLKSAKLFEPKSVTVLEAVRREGKFDEHGEPVHYWIGVQQYNQV